MHVRQLFSFRRLTSSSLPFGWKRTSAESTPRALLGVLSLGIMGNTQIRIIAGGPDEEQAVDELVKLVESGFAE